MKVSYNRLWKLMIDKKMKNSELQKKAQISGNIITRLNKDEFVSMETIAKICDVLDCGVDDILKFSKDRGGFNSGSKNKDKRSFYGRDFMEICG